jgi:hypothetical protein
MVNLRLWALGPGRCKVPRLEEALNVKRFTHDASKYLNCKES